MPDAQALNDTIAAAEQAALRDDAQRDARLAAWAVAYEAFGTKANRTPCSAAALLKRVRKDGSLPRISPLVDAYNAVSVLYGVPIGRSRSLPGVPRLLIAKGAEPFDTIEQGEMVTEHPEPGEVIWCDDSGVTCRRWNWRQGRRTMGHGRYPRHVARAGSPRPNVSYTDDGHRRAFDGVRESKPRGSTSPLHLVSLRAWPTFRRNTPLSPVRIWRSLLAPLAYTVDCERPRTALENKRRTKSDHCLFSLSVVWRTFIAMPPVGMVQIAQARSSDRGEA
ncbi:phenylalanine--tRNA ligase beta subunit-related protein [Mesorhizobium sp. M0894]|uniref:B3/B4 domain-containing protein n=1 Tax=unclassified Mesorhizobium TaxID=325217 RepID=UPI00333BF40F